MAKNQTRGQNLKKRKDTSQNSMAMSFFKFNRTNHLWLLVYFNGMLANRSQRRFKGQAHL
jgi:hypothetical protein